MPRCDIPTREPVLVSIPSADFSDDFNKKLAEDLAGHDACTFCEAFRTEALVLFAETAPYRWGFHRDDVFIPYPLCDQCLELPHIRHHVLVIYTSSPQASTARQASTGEMN